jgi:hypothetical protein
LIFLIYRFSTQLHKTVIPDRQKDRSVDQDMSESLISNPTSVSRCRRPELERDSPGAEELPWS